MSGFTGSTVLLLVIMLSFDSTECSVLTLLVLSKGDAFLIGGVQNPEDCLQVGVVEQVWPFDPALLGELQLLNEKLSGIL